MTPLPAVGDGALNVAAEVALSATSDHGAHGDV
jgi:hypothetical protein